jgi:hypothetical protein
LKVKEVSNMETDHWLGALCLVALACGGVLVLLLGMVLQLLGRVANLTTQVATLSAERETASIGCAGPVAMLVLLAGAFLFVGALVLR